MHNLNAVASGLVLKLISLKVPFGRIVLVLRGCLLFDSKCTERLLHAAGEGSSNAGSQVVDFVTMRTPAAGRGGTGQMQYPMRSVGRVLMFPT